MLAEQDRDVYRRNQAALAREKEIMKDVPGWEVSAGGQEWAAEGTGRVPSAYRSRHGCDESAVANEFQVGKSAYNSKKYTPSTIVVL